MKFRVGKFIAEKNDNTAIVIYPRGIPLDVEDYEDAVFAVPLWSKNNGS